MSQFLVIPQSNVTRVALQGYSERSITWLYSRAVRRRHCVGGALVNFDRRRGVGGQQMFFKDSRKMLFYSQNCLMTFFSHQKLQQNKCIATMASAARRQIIGGAPINKSRRLRRPQIVGGGGAAWPANGSTL